MLIHLLELLKNLGEDCKHVAGEYGPMISCGCALWNLIDKISKSAEQKNNKKDLPPLANSSHNDS